MSPLVAKTNTQVSCGILPAFRHLLSKLVKEHICFLSERSFSREPESYGTSSFLARLSNRKRICLIVLFCTYLVVYCLMRVLPWKMLSRCPSKKVTKRKDVPSICFKGPLCLLSLLIHILFPLNLLHRRIVLSRPGHHKKILLNLSEMREGGKARYN